MAASELEAALDAAWADEFGLEKTRVYGSSTQRIVCRKSEIPTATPARAHPAFVKTWSYRLRSYSPWGNPGLPPTRGPARGLAIPGPGRAATQIGHGGIFN